MPSITLTTLHGLKQRGEKIVMLTCYDATFAHAASTAGVEMLLVGDTLGMILHGHDSTLPVDVDDVVYHTVCVKRGNAGAFIVADLPFMSYATTEQALHSAGRLMRAGAHMVKLEGDRWLAESIRRLTENGVPVCAHLGLTPQSVNVLGGFKVQGRDPVRARQLVEAAIALEESGAAMLLVECLPSPLAEQLSQAVRIPVIGIGAGAGTDGQVLVLHDMLGLSLTGRTPKFVRNFLAGQDSIQSALEAYVTAVKNGAFPSFEHGYSM
ncbi:MAG: 3-methyl-2-oxobutanoate hydroxymethyltransferase [Pseudomonadota bacterium]